MIAYAIRALSDVEKHYSQKEKEALSIIGEMNIFTYSHTGKEFTLVTYRKPLEVIYGKQHSDLRQK